MRREGRSAFVTSVGDGWDSVNAIAGPRKADGKAASLLDCPRMVCRTTADVVKLEGIYGAWETSVF